MVGAGSHESAETRTPPPLPDLSDMVARNSFAPASALEFAHWAEAAADAWEMEEVLTYPQLPPPLTLRSMVDSAGRMWLDTNFPNLCFFIATLGATGVGSVQTLNDYSGPWSWSKLKSFITLLHEHSVASRTEVLFKRLTTAGLVELDQDAVPSDIRIESGHAWWRAPDPSRAPKVEFFCLADALKVDKEEFAEIVNKGRKTPGAKNYLESDVYSTAKDAHEYALAKGEQICIYEFANEWTHVLARSFEGIYDNLVNVARVTKVGLSESKNPRIIFLCQEAGGHYYSEGFLEGMVRSRGLPLLEIYPGERDAQANHDGRVVLLIDGADQFMASFDGKRAAVSRWPPEKISEEVMTVDALEKQWRWHRGAMPGSEFIKCTTKKGLEIGDTEDFRLNGNRVGWNAWFNEFTKGIREESKVAPKVIVPTEKKSMGVRMEFDTKKSYVAPGEVFYQQNLLMDDKALEKLRKDLGLGWLVNGTLPYEHPVLRTIANINLFRSLARVIRERPVILDIGCKPHQMLAILPEGSTLIAICPSEFDNFNDRSRDLRHPESELKETARARGIEFIYIREFANAETFTKIAEASGKAWQRVTVMTSFDSIYYDGVAEFASMVLMKMPTVRFVGTYMQYNTGCDLEGKHIAFPELVHSKPKPYRDGEGYWQVGETKRGIEVRATPLDNPDGYQHPPFGPCVGPDSFATRGLMVHILHHCTTGTSSAHAMFEAVRTVTLTKKNVTLLPEKLAALQELTAKYGPRFDLSKTDCFQQFRCYVHNMRLDLTESDEAWAVSMFESDRIASIRETLREARIDPSNKDMLQGSHFWPMPNLKRWHCDVQNEDWRRRQGIVDLGVVLESLHPSSVATLKAGMRWGYLTRHALPIASYRFFPDWEEVMTSRPGWDKYIPCGFDHPKKVSSPPEKLRLTLNSYYLAKVHKLAPSVEREKENVIPFIPETVEDSERQWSWVPALICLLFFYPYTSTVRWVAWPLIICAALLALKLLDMKHSCVWVDAKRGKIWPVRRNLKGGKWSGSSYWVVGESDVLPFKSSTPIFIAVCLMSLGLVIYLSENFIAFAFLMTCVICGGLGAKVYYEAAGMESDQKSQFVGKPLDFVKTAPLEPGVFRAISWKRFAAILAPNHSCIKPRFFKRENAVKTVECDFADLKVAVTENYCKIKEECAQTYFGAGTDINDLQIMAQTDQNTFSAVNGRHFVTRLLPNPKCIAKFLKWTHTDMERRFKSHEYGAFTQTWEEFLLNSEPSKAKLYDAVMTKMRKQCIKKPSHRARFFMKTMEKALGETRPRNICALDPEVVVITAPVVRILMKIAKEIYPDVISGYNFDETADKLEKEFVKLDPVGSTDIATDGSSWDSHQHRELRKHIDNKFIKQFFDEAFTLCGLDENLREWSREALLKLDWEFVCNYPGTMIPMMTGVLSGTTISGHAAATTLGNSLRQHYAHAYAARGLRYAMGVSGDDVVMRIHNDDLLKFEQRYWKYHSKIQGGMHGLGLCSTGIVKNSTPTEFRTISFLSKDLTIIPGASRLARPPERLCTADFIDSKKLTKAFGLGAAAAAVTIGNMHNARDPITSKYQANRAEEVGSCNPELAAKVMTWYKYKFNTGSRNHNLLAGSIEAMYESERGISAMLNAPQSCFTEEANLAKSRYDMRFPAEDSRPHKCVNLGSF